MDCCAVLLHCGCRRGNRCCRDNRKYKDLVNVSTEYHNLANSVYSSQWSINPETHHKIMNELKKYINSNIGMDETEKVTQVLKFMISQKEK